MMEWTNINPVVPNARLAYLSYSWGEDPRRPATGSDGDMVWN